MAKSLNLSLYVGCGLTNAPEAFRDDVDTLKHQLGNKWNVMRFLGLTDGSSGDVYDQDIEKNVRECDAFLAVADHPATGLGWELGVADERKTPTLIVVRSDSNVTRLVIGAAEKNEHIKFERYESMSQIPKLVEAVLRPMVQLSK